MDNRRNHKLVENARNLRREMTKEERHLWYDYLRDHPAKFRRQAVFGKYIADFYCAKAKLVIELDCSHRKEPGCAVTTALAAGEIGKSRYESYLKLYEKAMQINEWELK